MRMMSRWSVVVSLCAAAVAMSLMPAVLAAGPKAADGEAGRGRGVQASPQLASAEVAALKPAFNTLLGADHDYDGHRVKAMRDIAQACRLLGTDILPPDFEERIKERKAAATEPATQPTTQPTTRPGHGGKEPEAQSTSDSQLKSAQATVQQVLGGIPAGTQPRVVERLTDAVSELNTALGIK